MLRFLAGMSSYYRRFSSYFKLVGNTAVKLLLEVIRRVLRVETKLITVDISQFHIKIRSASLVKNQGGGEEVSEGGGEVIEGGDARRTYPTKMEREKEVNARSCYGEEILKNIHKKKPNRRLKVPSKRGSRLPQRLSRELYEQISSSESSQNVGIKKQASRNDDRSISEQRTHLMQFFQYAKQKNLMVLHNIKKLCEANKEKKSLQIGREYSNIKYSNETDAGLPASLLRGSTLSLSLSRSTASLPAAISPSHSPPLTPPPPPPTAPALPRTHTGLRTPHICPGHQKTC
ncbi:uncharacterized protein LOC120355239 [Nilaparvata lugens]|uniref:uncharacterized protein LOC120355239 n=1 Tax=Nilaparvata lugens TaxID=108931 RepID=UPI00193CF0B3|nr:uncharacterized protein LOC120355239 [Nilaparvata lugens]